MSSLYATTNVITVPSSPSLLCNNLSSDDHGHYCYVHLSEVIITDDKKLSSTIQISNAMITQASYINIANEKYIVVTSNLGVHLYSSTGKDILYFASISTLSGNSPTANDSYYMGIAKTGKDGDLISIGTSYGDILLLEIIKVNATNYELQMKQTLSTTNNTTITKSSITALVSSSQYLIASNDHGDIYGYNPLEKFHTIFTFIGRGLSCTSMVLKADSLITSYISGHIRIYRLNIQELAIEINGHSSCIYSLSKHMTEDMFVSCSDDHYVHVWSLPTFTSKPNSTIELLSTTYLPNKICTGIICNHVGNILVASYDMLEVQVLEKKF